MTTSSSAGGYSAARHNFPYFHSNSYHAPSPTQSQASYTHHEQYPSCASAASQQTARPPMSARPSTQRQDPHTLQSYTTMHNVQQHQGGQQGQQQVERRRPPYDFPDDVITTETLRRTHDTHNNIVINQYLIGHRLGNGQHGEVYKGFDITKGNMVVAIKACRRKNPKEARIEMLRQNAHGPIPHAAAAPGVLSAGPRVKLVDQLQSAEKKTLREIAIMKKCKHGQIVQLLEVIDDRLMSKIFMVMEYMGGGEVKWRDDSRQPVLRVDQARRITRDVVLGLEYLHHQGIIHRDIKPANLLWTADRKNVKITDFGVSNFSYAQRLAALRESPAYTEALKSRREMRARRLREEEAEDEKRRAAETRGRGWRGRGQKDAKGKGKAQVHDDSSSSTTPWDSANTTPGDVTPSSSAMHKSAAALEMEDSAAEEEAVLASLMGALDPILFDESGLSRQAGTPSFLAPELVWEFRPARQAALRRLATGSGSGGRSNSGNETVGDSEKHGETDDDDSVWRGGDHEEDGTVEGNPTHLETHPMGGTPQRPAHFADMRARSSSNPDMELERTPKPPLKTHTGADDSSDVRAAEKELPITPPEEVQPDNGHGSPHSHASVHLGETLSTVPDPHPGAPVPLPSIDVADDPPPRITKAIDVWALGVTLYCLLFGDTPWTGKNEFLLYAAVHAKDFSVGETMGYDRLRTGGKEHAEDDTSEGAVVMGLLGRLLEKDCTKRITLDEVKRLPWITRDIPDPNAWLRETSPYLRDPINVSAADESDAMSVVKFRWKPLAEGKSRLVAGLQTLGRLLPGRKRAGSTRQLATLPDEDDSDGHIQHTDRERLRLGRSRTDSHAKRAGALPGEKEPVASAVKRSDSRSRRLARATAGAMERGVRKMARHHSTATGSTTELQHRRKGLSPGLLINTRRDGSRSRESSRSRPNSPAHTPRQLAGSTSNLTSPSTAGYTTDDILDEDDEQALAVRLHEEQLESLARERLRQEKQRSRLSLGIPWRQKSSRSSLSEQNKKGKQRADAKDAPTEKTFLSQRLARRSADAFRPSPNIGARTGSGPAYSGIGLTHRSGSGELTSAMRASSWGEVADEYAADEYDLVSDYDGASMSIADDDMMMIGAGGVLSHPVSMPSSPNSHSGGSIAQSPIDNFRLPDAATRMAPVSLALAQSQGDHLFHSPDVPVMADPALQEGTGYHSVRQRTSHHHHLSSPLAQTPYVVEDEDAHVSRFDEEYMRSHTAQEYADRDHHEEDDADSFGSGERVYGQGSTTLDDDDDLDGSSSDEDEPPPIEIRRRRPSESLARSHSRIRRDDEVP